METVEVTTDEAADQEEGAVTEEAGADTTAESQEGNEGLFWQMKIA